jgi:pyrroline-5-carboxylate reductase
MIWYVYILHCGDNTLYTGVTTDVTRRLSEHETGKVGAKYTRARGPLTVVYTEECASRSTAQIREAAIKKLSRPQKEVLISEKQPKI